MGKPAEDEGLVQERCMRYIGVSAASPTTLEEFARLCVRNGGRGGPALLPLESRDG
jgi:hypothetical protein